MFRHQKGQGLLEFALILPLLLILLLGVIEAGRVIWAFITVQTAAREATRYAVTGRPYLDSNASVSAQRNICLGIDPEVDSLSPGSTPWLCLEDPTIPNPLYHMRVEAIKQVALSHGRNLAHSDVCDQPEEYLGLNGNTCNQSPGALGVLIQGQVTTETITGTVIVQEDPVINHPGQQGLNIQVSTFYNLEMITPVFNAIMGGNFVRLEGRAQLQNEGLDAASGIDPPPGINPPPTPESGTGGSVASSATIVSVSGYNNIKQTDVLVVHGENHSNGSTYDIYLGTYKICSNVAADASDNLDTNCDLAPTGIAPGLYPLYSTRYNETSPRVATAPEDVEIVSGGDPTILVEGGTIWAANETTDVKLLFHPFANQPYTVKLFDSADNEAQVIVTGHDGISTNAIAWTAPDLEAMGRPLCDLISGNQCTIRSYDNGDNLVAEVKVNVNQPKIILTGGVGPYKRGEAIYIFLRGHTPSRRYDIEISPTSIAPPDIPPGPQSYSTLETNAVGDTTNPIVWIIPGDCGLGSGHPDGLYQAVSRPRGLTDQIAILENVEILGPNPDSPFLSVEGGTTWFAGTLINIRVLEHLKNHTYYLEFDGNRIPTQSPPDDTFVTGTCGDFVQSFTIPAGTDVGTYTIASYDNDDGQQKATIDILVLATPAITVLEGDRVLPDQTVTFELTNHLPFFSYDVFYANKKLFSVLTDENGRSTRSYDLKTLPTSPPPDLSFAGNLGIPYDVLSQPVLSPTVAASTTLTMIGADLTVLTVTVPSISAYDTEIPVEVVVQNTQPVTINRYVDIDLYFLKHPEPDPFGPSYLEGYNFPGDIKYWRSFIGPNEVFTITHPLTVTRLGLESIYGYADTSNNVFELEGTGQVANPNNINNSTTLVGCTGTLYDDFFDTDVAQGDPIPGWSVQRYGNAVNAGFQTEVAGGQLLLNSSGSSINVSNDNSGGELFFHRTDKLPSASGLDVQVKITDVTVDGTVGPFARGGLEIRNSLDPSSPRVILNVTRNNGASTNPRQFVVAGIRNGASMSWVGGLPFWLTNHQVDLAGDGPIWLRIERESGVNGAFNFYYRFQNVSGAPPPVTDEAAQLAYWGPPVQSATVSGMSDNLFVGMLNSPYVPNTAGTSTYDDFSAFPDPAACPGSTLAGDPIPPGLQVCTEGLEDRSFEETIAASEWKTNNDGVTRTSGSAHSGNNKMRALTEDSLPTTPHFWQKFAMPDWVISTTTTFDVSFYHRVFNLGVDEVDDEFYAIVATSNNPGSWTAVTDPVLIADGEEAFDPSEWILKTIRMDVATGINLEDYANQDLYMYFYNDSNIIRPAGCVGPGNTCASQFEFDDMSLITCTTQPKPSPISTRIRGTLTLNFSDGSSGVLPYVKVWAYAEDNQTVYETFTIQGGEYNFYNLPATAAGTQYTIFAQHNLVQGASIETLAADTSIILKSSNDDGNPAEANLDLYTLAPRP